MSLDQIPDEIVHHLLYYVSPEDNLANVQLLSRRLRHIASEPLLWRYYCQHGFKFWNPEHNLPGKLKERASEVDWKGLFLLRKRRNEEISGLFDHVLATKVNRVRRTEQIAQLGYDAKDFLLEQCQADDSVEDVLARRYHGNSILDSLHRSLAIEQWHQILAVGTTAGGKFPEFALERTLGAFDLFVLHDQPGDLDDIGRMLDERATEFLSSTPGVNDMTTRHKALALTQWLRRNNLTGLKQPEKSYRNLRNCFIGQALRHEDHDSIPIISSAIFCCIATRLGLRAHCCSFPTHVHAVVLPNDGETLDGLPVSHEAPHQELMYLDPYGSDDEVSLASLQATLAQFGWQTNTELFLAPASPVSVAMRTARNIKASFARAEAREQDDIEISQLMSGHPALNMGAALYASLWAILLMTPVNVFEWDESLEMFLRHFAKNWHEDAWIVQKYLVPLSDQFAPLRERLARHGLRGWDDPREILGLVRELDESNPPSFRRAASEGHPVSYKIGQVFRHRRYRWIGVINGWTDQGARRLPMPHTVAIDETLDDSSDTDLPSLVRPRNQNFYTCLRTTGIERHVVAEDNIVLLHNPSEVPEDIFALAGKFFKRFDPDTCTFVSNLSEEFPDD
ncbi:Transglutaminase-like superfamily-domain-containing protein [Thelonectria olida]|uniref:Transglutaminase-like superfamily-domain-containing protein n=1 Tax=Thelonectria olida TaxID=1576542 RepID=A0A9P9AQ91_9HYPO|nr:Transglutaminase-like superfamily-domain-containing protein [Thelonectria olida]